MFERIPVRRGAPTMVCLLLAMMAILQHESNSHAHAFSPFVVSGISPKLSTKQQKHRGDNSSKNNKSSSSASTDQATTATTTTSSQLNQASVAFPPDELEHENDDDPSVWQRMQRTVLARKSQLLQHQRQLQLKKMQQIRGGSFLKRHPLFSAVCITTCNAICADIVTQLVFEKAASLNVARTTVFGVFGCLYQGLVQYAIVNGVWENVFPGSSKRNIVAKICAMNLLSDPLFFMPTFYIFKEIMVTATSTTAPSAAAAAWSVGAIVKTALLNYKANCLVDWRNSWMVWFPGHAVTYGVMPQHKRIPWMAFLSFFYMCVLSLTRG